MGRFLDPDMPYPNTQGTMAFTFMKVSRVGKNKGGVDVLDVHDWTWELNAAWLDAAVTRMKKGEGVIRMLHDPRKASTFFKLNDEGLPKELAITGAEMNIALKHGYAPDIANNGWLRKIEDLDVDEKTMRLWEQVRTWKGKGRNDPNSVGKQNLKEFIKGSRMRNFKAVQDKYWNWIDYVKE